jgi:hypothetical protein
MLFLCNFLFRLFWLLFDIYLGPRSITTAENIVADLDSSIARRPPAPFSSLQANQSRASRANDLELLCAPRGQRACAAGYLSKGAKNDRIQSEI